MATSDTPSLHRAITAPMLMLFILGDVLGAGVYALAGTIAGRVGGAIWAPLLIALCFALLQIPARGRCRRVRRKGVR